VGAPGSEKELPGSKKGGKVGKTPPEAKEKLGVMVGEHVLLHSYELVNQRGVYGKGARSSECLGLSPGMVLSIMVWGQSFEKVFKEETADAVEAFDIGIVQLGTKSMQSTSTETGQMLEIKAFTTQPACKGLSVGSLRVFGGHIVPASLQEAAVWRSRFADGSHMQELCEGKSLNQGLVKGNLSMTVSVVRVELQRGQGTFAIGADDVLRFHVAQPLVDLTVARVNVHYDVGGFGQGGKDWVCKLFNVLCLAGCMELLVILDTYKVEGKEGIAEEITMEAYARPNMGKLTGLLVDKKPKAVADVPFVQSALGVGKNVGVYELEGLVLAMDARKMTKRRGEGDARLSQSLVHAHSEWEKGYSVHFFCDERLVHCAVVPVFMDLSGAEGSKQVLNTIAPPKWGEDVEYEGSEACVAKKEEKVVATKRKRAAEEA
jgi:hypothetical protein